MVKLKGPKRQLPMEREREVAGGNDDEERAGGATPQKALFGAKLRRGISIVKRGGTCTPVCAWKLEEDVDEAGTSWADDTADAAAEADLHGPRTRQHHRHRISLAFPAAARGGAVSTVSARELGANLWEIQDTPGYRMGRRSTRTRRHREEKPTDLYDLSPRGHRKVLDFSFLASKQPLTPSPLDLKGKLGYSCRTSTELLKVLNRIWSLEEQQSSTMSLVTKLKLELENAYTHIEELLHEKQSNHHEIDTLTKQIVEDKLTRRSKEQEKIQARVKSLEAELEDEKSLGRHSESLHLRLRKELSEIKVAFSKIMRDLEVEKKSRNLLQDICDEFAKGIREYEDEVRELKQKYEKGCKHRCNSLILDFSEAWLDERLQIKLLDSRGNLSEKKKMVDKLECGVEAFLRARRSCSISDDVLLQMDIVKERCLHRQSLESIHLNGAGSAPQYAEDEDSAASDLHCFELNMGKTTERHDSLKHNGIREKVEDARKSNVRKKMVGSSEKLKYHGSSSSWMKFSGHTQSCNDVNMQFTDEVHGIHRHNTSGRRSDANLNIDIVSHQKLGGGEGQEDAHGMKDQRGSTYLVDHATEEAGFGKIHEQPEPNQKTEDLRNNSCELPHPSLGLGRVVTSGNHCTASSLVQKWSYHHVSPDLQVSESSKRPQGIKESSLKAKLLEARLEGQHGRLKTSRDSSVGA